MYQLDSEYKRSHYAQQDHKACKNESLRKEFESSDAYYWRVEDPDGEAVDPHGRGMPHPGTNRRLQALQRERHLPDAELQMGERDAHPCNIKSNVPVRPLHD